MQEIPAAISEYPALLITSARVYQWVKNVFILMPLIFSLHLLDVGSVMRVVAGFFVFAFTSSAVYMFNDVVDYEKDRLHPVKRKRPVASGLLPRGTAIAAALSLSGIALAAAWLLTPALALLLGVYMAVNLAYSFRLKEVIIIDVFCLASGFLLRVVAGAVIIAVPVSYWLLLCTMLLALFLGFAKRRHELILLGEGSAGHRAVLKDYTTEFLDQVLTILTTSAVICYMLYTVAPETTAKFGSDKLIYTAPVVFYWLFRYIHLIRQNKGTDEPSKIVFSDPGLLAAGLIWVAAVSVIIYANKVYVGYH